MGTFNVRDHLRHSLPDSSSHTSPVPSNRKNACIAENRVLRGWSAIANQSHKKGSQHHVQGETLQQNFIHNTSGSPCRSRKKSVGNYLSFVCSMFFPVFPLYIYINCIYIFVRALVRDLIRVNAYTIYFEISSEPISSSSFFSPWIDTKHV